MLISHGHNLIKALGCLTPARVREALEASQRSALLRIPLCSRTQSRFRSFPRQGWDESKSPRLLCPSQRVGYCPPRAHSRTGREAEAAQRCQLTAPRARPPSLAQPSRAPEWEGNESPARRARRESPSRQTEGIRQGGALVCLEKPRQGSPGTWG